MGSLADKLAAKDHVRVRVGEIAVMWPEQNVLATFNICALTCSIRNLTDLDRSHAQVGNQS